MRKLKKAFSLVLVLALCLGPTVPAMAATYTENRGGITITLTSNSDDNSVTISYTGTGKLTADHLEYAVELICRNFGLIYQNVNVNVGDWPLWIEIGSGITSEMDQRHMTQVINEAYPQWGLIFTSVNFGSAPQQPAGTTASPTNDKLEVNGNAADPTVYKINGSNYFKIRDVAALLNGTEKQFAVGYDGSKNAVTATTGQGYAKQSGDLAGAAKGGDQSAAASNDAVYVDGQKIEAEVYKIDGSNYFKLRDLGRALNFYVGWSAERGMYIETGRPYSE